MLPPHELKNKTFTRAMRGYNPVEVEEYIEFLIGKYTELYRENDELERKLKSAAAKLDEIKNDEDSIRSALIEAKRTATKIKAEAEERAEAIIRSAKVSCNTILSDFNEKIEYGRNTLISLKSNTIELKHELFERYSEHIKYIDQITEGIDMSEIPETDQLRRKAVNSLKSNIAGIYAATDVKKQYNEPAEPEQTAPEPAGDEYVEPEVPDEYQDEYPDDTGETIEFTPAASDTDAEFAEETHIGHETSGTITEASIFGELPSSPDSDEPALVINREPLAVKPAKSGLKGSIRELNQRYKESQDIINTPDSDLDDDANYLDFVKSVTGTVSETGKDSDFDLLFNESKNKKKKQ